MILTGAVLEKRAEATSMTCLFLEVSSTSMIAVKIVGVLGISERKMRQKKKEIGPAKNYSR